jgi:NTE family protein
MGYSPHYIYALFKKYAKEIAYISNGTIINEIRRFIFNKKVRTNGIKDGKEIEEVYDKLALKKGVKKIKDIKMPLVIPTVDMAKAEEYVFTSKENKENKKYLSDISVGKAVRASSSFPVIMNPCKYKEHIFSDGGILNNVPVNHVKNMGADKVIAVTFDSNQIKSDSNVMDIMMKTVDIMGDKISEENLKSSDYILEVPSDGTGLLDTSKIEFCYSSRI